MIDAPDIACDLIDKILVNNNPAEIFDMTDWKASYKSISKTIHPDVSSHPQATEAFAKLNELKSILLNGRTHVDDAGLVTYFSDRIVICGEPNILQHSLNNFNLIRKYAGSGAVGDIVQRYIPESGKIEDGKLIFTVPEVSVPLSSLKTMEQKHVNWILSRVLEFVSFVNRLGYSHAGITPESIYVVPKTHGIYCISFYHLTKLDTKLATVSSKYKFFYPSKVFREKLALGYIDVDLAKRVAIYLLGDKSGIGVKLKATHQLDIINFLQKSQADPAEALDQWRSLLKKHFDLTVFHELKL